MTRFYRWLESMGQDPRTFWKDAIVFAARFYGVIFIVLLPIMLLFYSIKFVSPNALPVPAAATKQPLHPAFLLILIPFGLYLFFAVATALSLLGGWRKLAHHFPALPPDFNEGQLFRWQSGSIGVVGYKQVLTVRIAPQGLYLACVFPFRLMHLPLLIPWSQIEPISRNQLFGKITTNLIVGTPKIATIVLNNPKIIEAARSYLPDF